jgi:glutamate synthase domain-containing protein 1
MVNMMTELEGQIRIPSGCALSGIINRRGNKFSGEAIIKSIALMHDRSNGLGGGFAAYGIYPEFKDFYALHLMYLDQSSRDEVENIIKDNFIVEAEERIPTRNIIAIQKPPTLWRYFVLPKDYKIHESKDSEDNFMVSITMRINSEIKGAYVISSGRNMGAFKGVGFPEDIGNFFRLEEYSAHTWIGHGRFPTNTPGWWGGAHPFTLLDWSIVHNGEVSSYGANRRYLEMFQYLITLQTDTEVIAYAIDLLARKHKLPLELIARVLAPPFWNDIDRYEEEKQLLFRCLRIVYGSLLMNGPFSIIVGFSGGMMALNDRLKLRSLTAAEKGDLLMVASEESAIREFCPDPDRIWYPRGGEPVIGRIDKEGIL